MTGILLIVVAFVWLCIAYVITGWVTQRLKPPALKLLVSVVVFPGLLVLPLLDELIADRQFAAVCTEGAVLKIDAERIKGRKVRLAFEPANAPLAGMAVPVMHTKVRFLDVESERELGSYGRYVAKGGVLIRALGISQSDSPLWISPSYCLPEIGPEQMAERYQFEIVRQR